MLRQDVRDSPLQSLLIYAFYISLQEETRRREHERRQIETARRSIQFGGMSLDTGDTRFPDNFRGIAEEWLAKDDTWFERSRHRIKLAEFQHAKQAGMPSSSGGWSGRSREKQLTEAQRGAMGMAGEWLTFQYLLIKTT